MKNWLLLTFALLSTYLLTAQKISGTVKNFDGAAIGKATIMLKNTDNHVLKQSITSENGNYLLDNIPLGSYILQISSVGYHDFASSQFIISEKNHLKNDTIVLQKASTILSNVTVNAKKPPIETKAGKIVLHVDALASNSGINALELLEKTPGVSVDNDGNISIKGKQGVMVMIDGKPTYLNGSSLAAYLKSISSNNLDQIEIMTQPPAKYDAAGNSGVVNIKTKKGNTKGLNGNATLNLSQYKTTRLNGAANLNYRNEKWNVFVNYGGGYKKQNENLILNRFFFDQNMNMVGSSFQTSPQTEKGNYHDIKLGTDYAMDSKNLIGVVLSFNFDKEDEILNSSSIIYDGNGSTNYKLKSKSTNSDNDKSVAANLNFKHSFNKKGKELSFDFDKIYYHNKNGVDLKSQYFNSSDIQQGADILMLGKLPAKININSFKADFVQPFNSNTKIETGVKSSFVSTNNKVDYMSNRGSGWYNDVSRSNHFIYKENINAVYAIFSKSIKKWEWNAGLRLENTHAKGEQLTKDSSFTRSYTNLFPSVDITYTINDKNQLSASYSRRIDRPDYDNLNPFIFYIDSLTYNKGNPYLKPQFSNNVELTHSFNRLISTTINYSVTHDIITNLLRQEGEKTFQTNENFSKMKQLGAAITLNKQWAKWWMFTGFVNVFHNQYKGMYIDGNKNFPLDVKLTSLNTNISNSFKFNKGWGAELSGWYRSKTMRGLLTANAMGALQFSISKKILKNNGTIKLGVQDVLNTQQFNGYAKYANVDTRVNNTRESRRITLGFTLKFGKSNIAPSRKRSTGATEEQQRAGGGGGNS